MDVRARRDSGDAGPNTLAARSRALAASSGGSSSAAAAPLDDAAPAPFAGKASEYAAPAHHAAASEMSLSDEARERAMHERWKSAWDEALAAGAAAAELPPRPARWWSTAAVAAEAQPGRNAGQRHHVVADEDEPQVRGYALAFQTPAQREQARRLAQDLRRERFYQRLADGTASSSRGGDDAGLRQSHVAGLENPDAPPTHYPGRLPDGRTPVYTRPDADDPLALILPLLILLSTLIFLLILFIVLVVVVRRRARIALTDGDGPLDVGREEELEGHGGLRGVEERWLETVSEAVRRGYARAKDWTTSYPPGSLSTDITLSQFLSIQEKGVSAWSFDPDYESNPGVFVEARTEITFVADGGGMSAQEGGGCCVQSNLPLPKLNEVYYWEAKIFTKPEDTTVALGLATKPFPSFRLPGWSKFSVGYFSNDGFKAHNYPFTAQSYGPPYVQGDVIGIGYRPRTGTVFFTRNGKKHDDAFVGLNRHNLFPTVGANGAAEVHINLGQAGFVFIEANVKRWGLAPMVGTLGAPPAYGQERGSLLIEAGQSSARQGQRGDETPPPPLTPQDEEPPTLISPTRGAGSSTRSSATRRSRAPRGLHFGNEEGSARHPSSSVRPGAAGVSPPRRSSASSADAPHNPPTPNALDISLHQLPPHQLAAGGAHETVPGASPRRSAGVLASYFPASTPAAARDGSPPPYSVVGHGSQQQAWPSTGLLPGGGSQRRSGGSRTQALANAFYGALQERGLLTPLLSADRSAAPGAASPDAVGDYERAHTDHDANTARNTDANRRASWLSGWFA